MPAKETKSIETGSDAAARAGVLEQIQSRVFKVLLKAEALADLEANVREYWRLARAVARQHSAIVSESREAGVAQLREVVLFDTPAADLHGQGYALRARAPYVRGRPGAKFALLLAYRGPDALRAAAADVRSAPQYEGVETFKEELLPATDRLGGMRSVFAHACSLKHHSWDLGNRVSEASRVFPGLSDLKVLPTASLKPVGEVRIEEAFFELGKVDFGGYVADVRMAVWRDAATQKVLVGEFSFETQFHRYGKLHPQPKLRSERFYSLLQQETGAWLDLGTTKSALVYAMAGIKPRHAA